MSPLARALLVVLGVALAAAPPARAFDVTATVGGGALKIKGDAGGNAIKLDQVGLPLDSVRVSSLAASTTINGGAGPVVLAGLTGKGTTIALGDGADLLRLDGVTLAGKMTIKMEKGPDVLDVQSSTFQGDTKIDAGAGDNGLQLCGSTFAGALTLKIGKAGGEGNAVSCPSGANANVGNGSVVVVNGGGVTGNFSLKSAAYLISVSNLVPYGGSVSIQNSGLLAFCEGSVAGPFLVKLWKAAAVGGQISCLGPLFQADASGSTAIAMEGATLASTATVKGGNLGLDTVVLAGVPIGALAKFDLGAGENFLFLGGVTVTAGDLVLKGGKGTDTLEALDLGVSGNATVKYGDGNNSVTFTTSSVGGDLLVKTGKGDDSITASGVTVGGIKTVDPGKGSNTVQ
jgi:hypothetical protein